MLLDRLPLKKKKEILSIKETFHLLGSGCVKVSKIQVGTVGREGKLGWLCLPRYGSGVQMRL